MNVRDVIPADVLRALESPLRRCFLRARCCERQINRHAATSAAPTEGER